MTLVNCTVVSTNNEVVHPWKISQVGDDKVSIRDFYHTTIEPITLEVSLFYSHGSSSSTTHTNMDTADVLMLV